MSFPSDIKLDINAAKKIDISGNDAESVSSLTWSSSDDSVASVSIKRHSDCIRLWKSNNIRNGRNKTESCEITVNLAPISVNIQKYCYDRRGKICNLSGIYNRKFHRYRCFLYHEEGTVIKIDEFGVIQALPRGTISVTAKRKNDITTTFTVTVTDADFTRTGIQTETERWI